jgi:hypothetical protein
MRNEAADGVTISFPLQLNLIRPFNAFGHAGISPTGLLYMLFGFPGACCPPSPKVTVAIILFKTSGLSLTAARCMTTAP